LRKWGTVAQPRALSVGLAHFDRHDRLDFAPGLARELAAALADLGYDVKDAASESMPSAELGSLVTGTLRGGEPGGLAIVHVVSHGEDADGDATVFALGSDGVRHGEASVAHWLTMHQDGDGPTALFLLDLCSAGTAARLPWQVRLDRPKGWVIAASAPGSTAYDGRFTRAVINVLRALGSLDVDPTLPHVPLSTVARAIRREVNRLIATEDAFTQQVVGSLVDITADAEPAFFPNPAYSPSPRARLRSEVDPGKLPYLDDLDEGLDAHHFIGRAAGLGGLSDGDPDLVGTGMVGCFAGRQRELRRISSWLDGEDDGALWVVTGSPGAGKSALLGVLVCAASPELRAATRPIWDEVARAPRAIDRLAAVHARQRGPAAVAASIARQLALPENLAPQELVAAVRGGNRPAVVVVDALDEADDAVRLMNELLLPLTEPAADGTPARVLVGVRPPENYPQFTPLFQRAAVVNLDDVDQKVLENDLRNYVSNLLHTTQTYGDLGGVVGEFALATARRLAAPDERGRRSWGPFLVAGLYTRHFVSAYAGENVVTDPGVAKRLGRDVPADLAKVLELDLDLQKDQPWLRPVLVTLAYARGDGMPVSLVARVAPVFAPGLPAPTVSEIRAALAAGKFYVRQSLDTDHSNLYRLFHEGLAETLSAQRPDSDRERLLDAILAPLGPAESRDWDAAEPYLFRHVVDHAVKAGRLPEIHDDPGLWLHPRFREVLASTPDSSELAVLAARFAGIASPAELALAAARAGQPDLARRAANLPGHPPLTWQPRWTLGEPGSVRPRSAAVPNGHKQGVAISTNGHAVLAVHGSEVRGWAWPETGSPESQPTDANSTGHLVAISQLHDDVLIGEGRRLYRWRNGTPSTTMLPDDVVAAVYDERLSDWVMVTVKGLVIRLARNGALVLEYDTGHRSDTWAISATNAGAVAVSLGTKGQLIVFTRHGAPVEHQPPVPVTAFAISPDGKRLAVGSTGWIGTLDLKNPQGWQQRSRHPATVTALAFGPDDWQLAVGGEDGGVLFIRQSEIHWPIKQGKAPITAIAISRSPTRVVAIDRTGTAFYCDKDAAGVLPEPASYTPSDDGPLVSAFETTGNTVLTGWTDGTLHEVLLPLGTAVSPPETVGVPVNGLAWTEVGGQPGLVIDTGQDYWLLCADIAQTVVLDRSSRWARDQFRAPSTHIVRAGELIEVVIEAGTVTAAGAALGAHPGGKVVHCAYVDNRPTAFTGGEDGEVRVWDLAADKQTGTIHIGRPVWRITTVAGRWLLVGAGGELVAFQRELPQ